MGLADAGPQQAQVVVDLGDRADRRPRVAGESPSIESTSGLSIWPRNWRAYALSDST
jgi:hypothetical protein